MPSENEGLPPSVQEDLSSLMGVSPFKEKKEELRITEESLIEVDTGAHSPTKLSLPPD
jgi:hypothetical protein